MKISQGFVAATPDGRFLHIGERTTHTGHHIDITVVDDIEQATVSPVAHVRGMRAQQELGRHLHSWIPVEIRREVILKGYGT